MRKISILGSTGSIGTQTLDVIRKYKDIEVVALSADKSVGPITEQIKEFKPRLVCMYSYDAALKLKETINMIAPFKGEILNSVPKKAISPNGIPIINVTKTYNLK